jgi:hypothetical protein
MSTMTFPRARLNTAVCIALALGLGITTNANAGDREEAKRIHDRLAGVPPTQAVLDAMEPLIASYNAGNQADGIAAAQMAMSNKNFYNVTLKNFVTPWTNEAQTVFAPLNDYTATVIGMVRDDKDFRGILSDDIIYTGSNTPAYANNSNAHYEALEDSGADLSNPSVLVERTQSTVTGLEAAATAGVITTRAAAKAFFVDGTNRAMFRFTLMNHLCNDLEQVKDTSYPPDRIRQDVSRSPGGDSRIFMNACVGCHSGMDPLAQAYAYYDYEYPVDGNNDPIYDQGQMVYNSAGAIDNDKNGNPTGTRVQYKYHINANNFEFGYRTPDDKWDNYWRTGSNSALGWDTNGLSLPSGGNGAKTMGVELANSEAFARCQVEKVFQAVCLRPPVDGADRTQIDNMVASFKGSTYKLKQVFAESALYCKGN